MTEQMNKEPQNAEVPEQGNRRTDEQGTAECRSAKTVYFNAEARRTRRLAKSVFLIFPDNE